MTCDTCYGNDYVDPLDHLRGYHRLFLADVDGTVWASNSYWAVEVPNDRHPLARTLALYNLPLEPATLSLSDTLVRTDEEVKDIGKLVLDAIPEGLVKVSPVTFSGAQVYVRGIDDEWLAVFDIPRGVAVLDARRLKLVESYTQGDWYATGDPHKMFVRKTEDGRVTAVLMTMKNRATGK